jgi:hypothetical protein
MGRSVPGGHTRACRFLSFQRMPFITLRWSFHCCGPTGRFRVKAPGFAHIFIRDLPRPTDAATLLTSSLPAVGRLVGKIVPAIRQTRPRRQLSSRSPALQCGIGEILQNALVKAIRQPS